MHTGLEAIIFGGPNGAGKTTLARQLLPALNPSISFLNVDEISRLSLASSPIAAGREMLRKLDQIISRPQSFAVETTLSSRMYLAKIGVWKRRGFRVTLHFIELPSADYAVERVRRRVEAGGHSVPERDIRRRFYRGLELFHSVYKPRVDEWYHWFSDDGGIQRVGKSH